MRYRFSPAFEQALRVRGLALTRVAEMADVAPSTVSAALRGRRLNVATAMRIARVVAACEVIPELEAWADPESSWNGEVTEAVRRDA